MKSLPRFRDLPILTASFAGDGKYLSSLNNQTFVIGA